MAEVGRSQVVAQLSFLPEGEKIIATYDTAIARFLAGETVEADPALPQRIQMLIMSLASPANLPFTRELWAADAAAMLAKVGVPTLVIIGKKDIQVDWQADGSLLQQASVGRGNVTFIFPENANHVLKHEPKPRSELQPSEAVLGYNAPEACLDSEALAGIVDWLLARA